MNCRICGTKLKPDIRSYNMETGKWVDGELDYGLTIGTTQEQDEVAQMYCPICGVIYRVPAPGLA